MLEDSSFWNFELKEMGNIWPLDKYDNKLVLYCLVLQYIACKRKVVKLIDTLIGHSFRPVTCI